MPQMLEHTTLNRLEFSRLFLTALIFKFSLSVTIKFFSYVSIRLIIINAITKVM
jgi:hypothetical protein